MENLKEKFLGLSGIEVFQRIELTHILPIYIGLDNYARYSLFIIVNRTPSIEMASSKLISTFVGSRQDGNWGITFSLIENKYLDQFVCFCSDIITSSRTLEDPSKGADFLCLRYSQWQKLFAKNITGILSPSEIKGLAGEMCFLLKKMIPCYGPVESLKAWCGPNRSDRDFECCDTWYEVKSTVSGSASVRISSVEQLDTTNVGHLVVMFLDKTSLADSGRLTLNNLYKMILSALGSDVLKVQLDTILLALGYYPNDAYDRYCYKFSGMDLYKVGQEFPCVRKGQLPSAVHDVAYSLSLSAIQTFKEANNG